jgi:solute carrier family 30 (zinc transporter), member 9
VAADGSRASVLAALGGNTVVMVAKFIGFFVTGSGAMLGEAVHTLADVMNQILLFIGIERSRKAADEEHQYGYQRERYVWALMSAVGIFFLGCGVTVYHGVNSLLHPHPIEGVGWALSVLLFALVVEGAVLAYAVKLMWKTKGEQPFWEYVRTKADPSAVAVLLEDGAACVGVLIAMTAIGLTHLTGQLWFDAVGSILIGLLLGVVAIWLIARNHALLVGHAVPKDAGRRIREVLAKRASVGEVVNLKSRVIDQNTYDVMVGIDFEGEQFAARLEPMLRHSWPKMREWEDFRAFAAEYADAVMDELGLEVDDIEAAIKEAVPEVKHIDLEPE